MIQTIKKGHFIHPLLVLCFLILSFPHVFAQSSSPDNQIESNAEFGDELKISGMLKMLKLPDRQGKLARMLYNVRQGKLAAPDFFKQMAVMGVNKDDLIEVKKQLEEHAVRTGDKSLMNNILGVGFAEGGTPAEMALYSWRRNLTENAIKETIKRFVDSGRLPKHGFGMMISHVGKWATQAEKAMTFAGDIDFSFVCNDTELAEAMKAEFEAIMKKQTGLSTIAIDAVATVHGRAGLEVYIGRHGMQFAEMQMKDNFYVDMTTGEQKKIGLDAMRGRLAYERAIADIQGIEVPRPSFNSEPGLSMEMVRHFDHDIVKTGVYGTLDSVLKASKYLHRSNEALANTNQKPADASLATLAYVVHDLDRFDPQTPEIRELLLKAIAEHFGVEPRVVWDAGQNRLMLDLDPGTIAKFHDQVKAAMWDNVQKGMNARYTDIAKRQSELLARKRKGENVAAEAENLRKDLVELLDMVEAEIKAFADTPVPDLIKQKAVQVKTLLEQLSKQTGVRKLSLEELKDKRLVEEMLRSKTPQSRKMVAAYVMEKALKAAETAVNKAEDVNTLLDVIDDGLLGELRGETGFAALEAEINDLKMARLQGKSATDIGNRVVAMKNQVKGAIAETNRYLNEKLQATSVGRGGMKLMMITGLADEMKAYGNALYEGKWDEFAAEFLRRRVPFVSSAEKAYMGNTYLAVWDVVTTLVPPLALPEAAWGLGRAIGEKSYGMYWSEQLALFSDSLYADAQFKLTQVQTQGEGEQMTKLGVYRLEATYYNNLRLDLAGFAAMRKEQVENLRKTVNTGHIDWQAYKNNFKGFTEWVDVSDTLRNNLTATDPALILLEEMINHVAVGDKFRDRMAELGLARWEEIKLGYILNLIDHLEKRKQAEDALDRGQLPDLFAELRKMAAELDIEEAVLKSLDTQADTSNYKALVNMLWQAKRDLAGQAATESEISRVSQTVLRYLDVYKQVIGLRAASLKNLPEPYRHDGSQLWLTGKVFLRGQPDADLAAAKKWNSYTIMSRMEVVKEMLAIKHDFLPNTRLESQTEIDFIERAWRHQLWMKPFNAAGQAARSNAWLDRSISHGKKRNEIYDEFRASLEQDAPVQLTLELKDAKDSQKRIKMAVAQASPTDELGKASATTGSDRLVLNLIKGRYRISIQAKGYQVYSTDETLGANLDKSPKREVFLVPLAGEPKDDNASLADDLEKEKIEKEKIEKRRLEAEQAEKDRLEKERLEKEKFEKEQAKKKVEEEKQKDQDLGQVDTTTYKFTGTFPSVWEGGPYESGKKFHFKRKKAVKNSKADQCASNAEAWGEVWGELTNRYHPRTIEQYRESLKSQEAEHKSWGREYEIKEFSVAGFKGLVIETKLRYRNGSGSMYGYKSSSTEAYLRGYLVKDNQTLEIKYNVGGAGCWNNTDRAFLEAQGNCTQSEARSILSSIGLAREDGFTRVPHKGLKLDGSDMPEVILSPAALKTLKPGDTISLSASVKNAKPEDLPIVYSWSGDGLVTKNNTAVLTAGKPCKYTISVTADGAQYPLGSASLSVEVGEIKVVAQQMSTPGKPVAMGTPIGLKATLTSSGKPVSGNYLFRWQPHPEVTFSTMDSNRPDTQATFTRTGPVKVWVQVLEKKGRILSTLAESDQIEIQVDGPTLALSASPASPYVGQDVIVTLAETPKISDDIITFWWESQGNTLNAGQLREERQYSFKAKDTKPVIVTAHAKARDGGEDLGNVAMAITARPYQIMVSKPKSLGPVAQIWKEGQGLVAVEGQIAVFQDVQVKAMVSPVPQNLPLRYKWTSSPEGLTIYSPTTRETRVNVSQTGSYTLEVTVEDSKGIELGKGTGQVSVTVGRNDTPGSGKKADTKASEKTEPSQIASTMNPSEPLDTVSKAAIVKQLPQLKDPLRLGKFDQSIETIEQAMAKDPGNKELPVLLDRVKAQKELADKDLIPIQTMVDNYRFIQARDALNGVRKKYPYYKPVLDMDKTIQDAWTSRDSRVNEAIGNIRSAAWNRDYKEALEQIDQARKTLPLNDYDKRTLAESESYLRPLENKKEAARGLFRSAREKFDQEDYQGCIDDIQKGFSSTGNLWNFNTDKLVHETGRIRVEAHRRLKEKKAQPTVLSSRNMSTDQSIPEKTDDIVGTWKIDANGYKGSLTLSRSKNGLTGAIKLDGKNETLENVSYQNNILKFTRPIPCCTQSYTGTLKQTSDGGYRFDGTFTQMGTSQMYKWDSISDKLIKGSEKPLFAPPVKPSAKQELSQRFKLVKTPEGITFDQAEKRARDMGGHLAVITSTDENEQAYAVAAADDTAWYIDGSGNGIGPWLGAYKQNLQAPPAQTWTWVTKEAFTYSNWASGEPNNFNNSESHLHYFGSGTLKGGTWNDINPQLTLKGFLVEFDAHSDEQPPEESSPGSSMYQLDFINKANHNRLIKYFELDNIPVCGHKVRQAKMICLSKCQTPFNDGVCYPDSFSWDVPSKDASQFRLASNLFWWGSFASGKPIARVTVSGDAGSVSFDILGDRHTGEWNSGSNNPAPGTRIVYNVKPVIGAETRFYLARFEFPKIKVSRVTIDLLTAAKWNDKHGVFALYGATLVNQ